MAEGNYLDYLWRERLMRRLAWLCWQLKKESPE
jgi:hypothetical protein